MNKTIAVDIDDTLNNFSEVLNTFRPTNDNEYNQALIYAKKDKLLYDDIPKKYYPKIREIHKQAYILADIAPGAQEFMQWLNTNGWRVVILTYRDLRNCYIETKQWLAKHGIHYDLLIDTSDIKAKVCRLWQIHYLIDDMENIEFAKQLGVTVFRPGNWEGIKQCLQ
ncbi:hypothetical protein [Sporolituus thermophilus]|uniref:Nucleotidase n=1 Tax=Sporolituus thermophilus DSM 23256 TaxID=1123285 RepID=A0A1G7KXA5_9FIRM|nr:hypothetical protein [Sporolituus thermophilus]SDF41877.1 hypothetical protein SAMN05660235_01505 [Sporolituus thermophilus DSM 23256]